MTRGRALRGVLALIAAGSIAALGPAGLASAVTAAPAKGDVTIRVDDISPSTPLATTTPSPLSLRIALTNTSGTALTDVRVQAYRGDPIGNQAVLDAALADRTPPTDGRPVPATKAVSVDLPDAAPVITTFATTTSILDDGSSGLCVCATQIYPIYLVARASDGTVVGSTATYLPSLLRDVAPVKVSWLWPLIDRPHRLVDDTVFTDDDLASSIRTGGRLDQALQTIEDLDDDVPITLVVDPELLDELEVMATGRYRVQAESGTTPGTGQAAAKDWLDRFAALLQDDSAVQVSLTPYADPDTETLAERGLTWDTGLPAAMTRRVNKALDGRAAATDVAWPAGGVVSRPALDALAASGVTTVVLGSAAVSPSTANGIPVAVTRLSTANGPITGAMTAPALQSAVATAVTADDDSSPAALPIINAEIAMRAIQPRSGSTNAVLAPPRYVDASPLRAARTIEDTSRSPFSTPVPVRDLVADRPGSTSRLRPTSAGAAHLPIRLSREAGRTSAVIPAIASLLRRSADARGLVDGLPRAVQRVTSSAWRNDKGTAFGPRDGYPLAAALADQVDAITNGVRIVGASRSYTLGSDTSRLPITVENRLRYTVDVHVDVTARDGLRGFSTPGNTRTTQIGPNAKLTLQIPSQLDRPGRIPVQAQLETPSGGTLGEPVDLTIRSTVFGVIGVVITVGAGAVLALALIVRFVRRLQRLRRKAAKAQTPPAEALAPAGEPAS